MGLGMEVAPVNPTTTTRWRLAAALLLVASGSAMVAAAWERWGGVCGLRTSGPGCDARQDHLYDVLMPSEPWVSIGRGPELAGWSLILVALVLPLLPWALTGRRPGLGLVATLAVVVPAVLDTGIAGIRSGLADRVVEPAFGSAADVISIVVTQVLVGWLIAASTGWARASAALLFLSLPLVGAFSYTTGSYDSAPWGEGIAGALSIGAGACLAFSARGKARAPASREAVAQGLRV